MRAGFPNGRRVSDDVTDIAARAVAGILAGGAFAGFPYNRIGDGVNVNDEPYLETFPYLGIRLGWPKQPPHQSRVNRAVALLTKDRMQIFNMRSLPVGTHVV